MKERILALAGLTARLVPAFVVGLVALASESAAARPELGVWIDDSGQGAVEIYICTDNPNRLCGRIVWLKEPLNAEGVPKHDRYNPNAQMQGRPICGLPILWGLGLMSDGTFDGGQIYDPKTGFTMWRWGWLSLVAVPNGMRLQQVRSKLAAYDRANDRDLGQTYSISEADSPRQLFQHLSEIVDMETFFYKDLDALDEAAEIAIIPERAIAQANALIELIPEGKQACFHIPIGQVDNYQDEEKAGTEH